MARSRQPEAELQRNVVAHLQARAWPDVVWLHPANGGQRPKVEAAIMRGVGVVADAPDLLLFRRSRSFATAVPRVGLFQVNVNDWIDTPAAVRPRRTGHQHLMMTTTPASIGNVVTRRARRIPACLSHGDRASLS
jgi:hypothetical protein